MLLGKMNVVRVNPYRSGQGEPPSHRTWPVSHPTGQQRSPIFGDGSRSPSCPVDEARQARMTYGVGDGDDVWRGQKRDRLRAERRNQHFRAVTTARSAQMTAFQVNPLPGRSRRTLHTQMPWLLWRRTKCENSHICRNRYTKYRWSLGHSM